MLNFLSHKVIHIPLNIPLSTMAGYYVAGIKGALLATSLSIIDLSFKYCEYGSYYLSFTSIGGMVGEKMANQFIKQYGICNVDPQCTNNFIEINSLKEVLPAGMSAIGIIAAYLFNYIEDNIVDYIHDNTLVSPIDEINQPLEVL